MLLLGAAILVIILVVVISSQPAEDSANATPTASSISGALIEGVEAATINQLEIRDHNTGEYVRLVKDTGGAWDIRGTYQSDVTDPDQAAITTQITEYAGIQFSDSFESSELAAFGLDQPAYTFIVGTESGGTYRLYVGGQNPAGTRYYVIAEVGETGAASTSAEATESASATEEVVEATVELTPETTVEATAEASAEVTTEALPDVWDIITEPRPTLTGTQTILLVSDTTLDEFISLIAAPPYGPTPTPTSTPTNTPNPFSEVDQTATASAVFATAYAQATATAQALITEEATAEVTAEATAE
jgi:hypothetical protein